MMLSSRICVNQDFREDQQTAPWMISKNKKQEPMKDDVSQRTQLTHLLRDGYCYDDDSSYYDSDYDDDSSDSDSSYEDLEHDLLTFDLLQMRRRRPSIGSTNTSLSGLSALTANTCDIMNVKPPPPPQPQQEQPSSSSSRPTRRSGRRSLRKSISCKDLFERMAKANETNSYFQDPASTAISIPKPRRLVRSTSSPSSTAATSSSSTTRSTTKKDDSSRLGGRPDQYLKEKLATQYTTESTFESKTWEAYFTAVSPERMAAHNLRVASTIRKGDITELRRLAARGNRLDGCNRQGESTIHLACRLSGNKGGQDCLELIRFLLEEGSVSIRVRDDCGRTPFHDPVGRTNPISN